MPEQIPSQPSAMTRTQLAALMLSCAAFAALLSAIGFAVIKMPWIGNAGLILAALLLTDAVLLIKNGLSFFVTGEQPYSWFYDFHRETEEYGVQNIPQEIRLELERKKHARYIFTAGVLLLFIHFSVPVILLSLVLMGYGGRRSMRHYGILAAYFSSLPQTQAQTVET